MNVLFVSYDGMTDPLGQSQVIPYLSGLTRYGHTFTILSCDKPEKYKLYKVRIQQLLDNAGIKWVSIPYTKKPPVLSTLKDLVTLIRNAERLMQKEKFDLVHCRSGIGQLVGMQLKKKYAIKFLNDIRGFFADERVDGGMWNIRNPMFALIYRFFKRKEREALILADYNVCLTHAGKQEILTWKGIPQPINISVVPCSVDIQLFDPKRIAVEDIAKMKEDLGIGKDDLVISYVGSVGGWYLTEDMLRFCKILLDKIPQSVFLFISNNDHKTIAEMAAGFGIPASRIIVRFAQRKEMPLMVSLSDYNIFFIKSCYSKISSSPTKHGEVMAMGIPVITNSGVGDIEGIIKKYNGGFVISEMSYDTFNKVAGAIQKKDMNFDSETIKKGAEEFYGLPNALKTYQEIYKFLESKE